MLLKKELSPRAKLDLPVDPHLWPRAVGSDLKNEFTDASGPNEFLCWWLCIGRLGGGLGRAGSRAAGAAGAAAPQRAARSAQNRRPMCTVPP